MGKAFNKDPHFELLQKASTIGIGCLVEVPNDSLTARYQNVRRGEERSEQFLLTSGKPQWSVIGLLLFPMFINNLPDNLINIEALLYAEEMFYNTL